MAKEADGKNLCCLINPSRKCSSCFTKVCSDHWDSSKRQKMGLSSHFPGGNGVCPICSNDKWRLDNHE